MESKLFYRDQVVLIEHEISMITDLFSSLWGWKQLSDHKLQNGVKGDDDGATSVSTVVTLFQHAAFFQE